VTANPLLDVCDQIRERHSELVEEVHIPLWIAPGPNLPLPRRRLYGVVSSGGRARRCKVRVGRRPSRPTTGNSFRWFLGRRTTPSAYFLHECRRDHRLTTSSTRSGSR
jgi:hypothetical protein